MKRDIVWIFECFMVWYKILVHLLIMSREHPWEFYFQRHIWNLPWLCTSKPWEVSPVQVNINEIIWAFGFIVIIPVVIGLDLVVINVGTCQIDNRYEEIERMISWDREQQCLGRQSVTHYGLTISNFVPSDFFKLIIVAIFSS